MLNEKQIKQFLLDDLENKRTYRARFSTTCSVGGCEIFAGEDLYFYGQKQKLCASCFSQVIAHLKGEL